jgi:hypothetical protein
MLRSGAVTSDPTATHPSPAPETRSTPSAAPAIAASVISVVLVALVASVPGSPLQPVLVPGGGPAGPLRWLADVLDLDGLSESWLIGMSIFGVASAAAAFLWIAAEAWRGRISMRTVVLLAVAYHVVVLLLPLLVSRDVYSYIAYGRIGGVHGANPYVQTPGDFPDDPVFAFVGLKWRNVPSVYGPLFTTFASAVTRTVRGLSAQVAVFRVTAVMASLTTMGLVAWVAGRRFPTRAAFAVAAFGLNPVVLFQSVASGHNDLLVACAVAGAAALLVSGRNASAVVVLTLGALVKATAALPLLLLLVWLVARRPRRDRWRAAARYGGLAAVIVLAVSAPFLQMSDPTLGLVEAARHEGWLAPSRLLSHALDAISGDVAGIVARLAFAAISIFVVAVLVRAVGSRGAGAGDDPSEADRLEHVGSWAWSLVLLMLLGPVLLPWYVTWALPVVWLLPRAPRVALMSTSTALAISQWTTEPSRFRGAYEVNTLLGRYAFAPFILLLLVWLLFELRRRLRSDLPLAGPLVLDEPVHPEPEPARSG